LKEREGYDIDIGKNLIDPRLINKIRKFIKQNKISEDAAAGLFKDSVLDVVLEKDFSIPLESFSKELGAFETIVKYLRENLGLGFNEIAGLSGRSVKTAWSTYHNSAIKSPERIHIGAPGIKIPVEAIKNKRRGVQENIVVYLKEKLGMSYHEIAAALHRDDRTIWTAYHRARKKI